MKQPYDSVLLVAFGGPLTGEQGLPFVKGIVGARPGAEPRIKEVASHYVMLGGSPFNALTYKQAEALTAELRKHGVTVPVKVGFRHWDPYVKQTVEEMTKGGLHNAVAAVMAPHQCWISDDWYRETVEAAQKEVGPSAPKVDYIEPWYTHWNFIKANAELIRAVGDKLGADRWSKAALVFSAHAIPINGCKQCSRKERVCPYSDQFEQSAKAITAELGREGYTLAYQSQAEFSRPWTQPDVNSVVKELAGKGVKDVVISPIGFLCDHIEVLYDLDVEARKTAEAAGVGYHRAATVGSHPKFIAMLADIIAAKYKSA
jgi:ferrochelatase